jgi:hypothetical protein
LPPWEIANVATSVVAMALGLITRVKCSRVALRLGWGVVLMNHIGGLFLRTPPKTFDYVFVAVMIYVVWSQWNALRPPQRVVQ